MQNYYDAKKSKFKKESFKTSEKITKQIEEKSDEIKYRECANDDACDINASSFML